MTEGGFAELSTSDASLDSNHRMRPTTSAIEIATTASQ